MKKLTSTGSNLYKILEDEKHAFVDLWDYQDPPRIVNSFNKRRKPGFGGK